MKKHKLNGLDYYLIYCIVACILYAIAEFITSSLTGITHDALTAAWFAFHGGEAFFACLIKKWKLKKDSERIEY